MCVRVCEEKGFLSMSLCSLGIDFQREPGREGDGKREDHNNQAGLVPDLFMCFSCLSLSTEKDSLT